MHRAATWPAACSRPATLRVHRSGRGPCWRILTNARPTEHSAGVLRSVRATQDTNYYFLRSESADGAPVVVRHATPSPRHRRLHRRNHPPATQALAVPDWMRPGCERVVASGPRLPPPGAGPSRWRRAGRAALLRAACSAVPSTEWFLVPAAPAAPAATAPGEVETAAGRLVRDLLSSPYPPPGGAASGEEGGTKPYGVLARLARWVGAAPAGGSGSGSGEAPSWQWSPAPPALCRDADSSLRPLRRALAGAEGASGREEEAVLWGSGVGAQQVQSPPGTPAAADATAQPPEGDEGGGGDGTEGTEEVEEVEEPPAAETLPQWSPVTQGALLRPVGGGDAGVAVFAHGEGGAGAVTVLVHSPALGSGAGGGTLMGWHVPAHRFVVPHTMDLVLRVERVLGWGRPGGSGSAGDAQPSGSS